MSERVQSCLDLSRRIAAGDAGPAEGASLMLAMIHEAETLAGERMYERVRSAWMLADRARAA